LIRSSLAYILFSFSRIAVYLALGVAIFFFGQAMTNYALGSFSRYLYIFGGMFISVLGFLIAFGRKFNNAICRRMQGLLLNKDSKTLVILGLLVGILPCAPLISVISYIGLVARTWWDSLIFSLYFGLGTIASPLFLLALGAGFIPRAIHPKIYKLFNLACGIVVIFLGARLIWRGL
jgi:sulfite exporter TauE/SafE